jgi:hypothetical protein
MLPATSEMAIWAHPTAAAVTTVQRTETLSKAAAIGLFASTGGKAMAQYASWVKRRPDRP